MCMKHIKAKGRAGSARPLLCIGLALLVFLAMAPAATAALLTPILTETSPLSPGQSNTPQIKGKIEGVIASGVVLRGLGPIARAETPNNIVRLYTDAECEGPVVGEGTVDELVTGGGVALDSPVTDPVTVFYATQTDATQPLEVSPCSNGLQYRYVTAAPTAPTLDTTIPASPANDNLPRLVGSADPEATVAIYAGAGCSGSPVASGSGAQLAGGNIQVAVADNTETTFSAKATLAGFLSSCSGPLTYTEVTPPPTPPPPPDPTPTPTPGDGGAGGIGGAAPVAPPPAPQIRTVPGGSANDNTPRVVGSAPGAGLVRIYATASCEGAVVARGSAAELAAGLPVRVMDNTAVALSAVGVAGAAVSRCSAPVVYVEDSLTPRTRITMAPAAKTAKRKAVIRFTDTTGGAAGAAFRCKIGKKKWRPCSSPLRLKRLKPRRYTVRVKASDPAGNVERKGAKRSFRVIRR